ncbi:hypothetical protein C9994_04895 [Marivirga lumbricoides]|uniref:HAMP domain-containing protein n=1 Tax=Marivirga lumbricoides TaxID=1046115 RepID=A0A2T4DT78_9BACT|nr:hypothetical protein C9994_04895 [Marivirga lumbricoides]
MRFKDLAIRKKFIFAFSFLLLLAFSGGLLVYSFFVKIQNFQALKNETAELMLELNKAQKLEKEFLLYGWKSTDFLEDGSTEFTELYFQKIQWVEDELLKQSATEIAGSVGLDWELKSLRQSVVNYKRTFDRLREMLLKRGFKDHGLEGEMRNYAHDLQKCISSDEKVFAFSLRKHEKDFALRKDLAYVQKLHKLSSEFIHFIEQASVEEYPHMTSGYKTETINAINAYKNHFDKIVQAEISIGLTQRNGLLLELENIIDKISPRLNSLNQKISQKNAELQERAFLVTTATLLLLLISVVGLIYLFRHTVLYPIMHLDNIVKKVLVGDTKADKELDTSSKDEIGSLSRNFQLMLENLRINLKQIKEKNKELEIKALRDAQQQWKMEGLDKFSDLMKTESVNLKTFAYMVISELVRYIEANQAAFFIAAEEGSHEFMEMKACYAYERKKSVQLKVSKGEGLVGQAWLEGELIYVTDIPDSYVKIKSGLGGANPNNILVLPLEVNDKIIGIIEIASFKVLGQFEVDFLIEVGSRIATTLNNLQMQQHTKELLAKSQQMTEDLRAQEEEVRQNMEELAATQDEMSRQNQQTAFYLNKIEKTNHILSGTLSKIYDGLIIMDDQQCIMEVNAYIKEKLYYNEDDVEGNSPELILKTSINKIIKNLHNDPHFLSKGISESKVCKMMDKFGKIEEAQFVITEIESDGIHFYSIMFNKLEKQKSNKIILQRNTRKL